MPPGRRPKKELLSTKIARSQPKLLFDRTDCRAGASTHQISKPCPSRSLRRSTRLEEIRRRSQTQEEEDTLHQPPSPPRSKCHKETRGLKQKHPDSSNSDLPDQDRKRSRVILDAHENQILPLDNPIATWAETSLWPENFAQERPRPTANMSGDPSNKRKASTQHESDRVARMLAQGIRIEASALLQKSSKDLCRSFLADERVPGQYPCYPAKQIPQILERVKNLNEARLQRDVTPWVVPSAENLFFGGETTMHYIGEEIQAEWTRCEPMGSTKPKPDYVAGLSRTSFTKEASDKLENYASTKRPFLFTPNLAYPFLICEAKSGKVGMETADLQNMHSASIAIKSIFSLYETVFGATDPGRVNELYGKILVFTVSHNNKLVNLYGHYAALSEDSAKELEFYRYDIDMASLTMRDGTEKFRAYSFVRNVYEKFAPEHRKRIEDAVAFLPAVGERTRSSSSASDLALESMDSELVSQEPSSVDDSGFKKPGTPASVVQRKELATVKRQLKKILQQMEQQRLDSKERERKLEQQMEEQRQRLEQQMEEQRQRLEQQMKEQRQQNAELQMEKQRQRLEQQMAEQWQQKFELQREIVSILKTSKADAR